MSISAQSISPQEGVSWKTADSEVIDIELPASTVPNVTLLKAKTVVDVVGEAKMASVNWQQLSGKTRAVMLLQLHSLIEAHANELIDLIVQESGRNIQEAMFDITKGLELIEWATCLSHGSPGKQLEITSGVFCQEARRPLGIVAVITPRCNLGIL